MIFRERPHGGPGRTTLAFAGLAAVLVLLAGAVVVIAYGAKAFDDDPRVTAVVPAAAGPIRERSPVQYRGVVVGTVTSVAGSARSSRITMTFAPDKLDRVPGNATVRLLPRTLFGDLYVELSTPDTVVGRLADGTVLRHDDSAPTAQLYAAATQLYHLLGKVEPAKLNAALSAVADAVDGRGAALGDAITVAHEALSDAGPLLDDLGPDLASVAEVTGQLNASAPDLFAALDDAVGLSKTLVSKKDGIATLLRAGIDISAGVETMLLDNRDRIIQVVHDLPPVLDVVTRHPGQLTAFVRTVKDFADAGSRVFAGGPWVRVDLPIVFTDPYPYDASDCPRYPGLDGPNCGAAPPPAEAPQSRQQYGGPVGPVGSAAEQQAIAELLGAPADMSTMDDQMLRLAQVMMGPFLRGAEVMRP
jgi:phospholipid/cholesterol/gamma-HCH transport system substrate-binding protein